MTTVSAGLAQDRSASALRMPLLIGLGVFFWFVAAMAIRAVGPSVLIAGSVTLPLTFFLASPHICWAFVWAGRRLSGAHGAAIFPALALMSSAAMLLDGLAITFFPALYGLPPAQLVFAGAWLLWGVALIQFLAFVQSRQRRRAG